MFPFPDGSFEKHGLDALKVYRPDKDSVIKFRRLDDLKETNIGIDIRTRRYAVVDCIIHRTQNVDAKLLFDIDRNWLKTYLENR